MSPTSSSMHTSLPTVPSSHDLTLTSKSSQSKSSPSYIDSHPQDHSKLKIAWDEMLSTRFLAPRVISVLPFYLSSTFVNIQTHAPLRIPMPPNSSLIGEAYPPGKAWSGSFDADALFKFSSYSGQISVETNNDISSLRSRKISQRRLPSWSSMHLAKTVQTVIGCKEAIWTEFEKLYCDSLPLVVVRPSEPGQTRTPKRLLREEFEQAWLNWQK
jgi:hypothetical protein